MSAITVVDCGTGNLQSVNRRLHQLGADVRISSNPAQVAEAAKILLPGVGHFGRAMDILMRSGLADALNEAVLIKRVPILGICLGMQLMASSSTEGGTAGLGWFSGSVQRFNMADKLHFKVPHMGWNQVRPCKDSVLLKGIDDNSEFYFVHSYHYEPEDWDEVLLTSEYSTTFTSGVERDNIFGLQFHPEKSHEAGLKMLRNFVEI